MSHFLYYAPGIVNADDKRIATLGLAHLRGLGIASRHTGVGPDGKAGALFAPHSIGAAGGPECVRLSYEAGAQDWTECEGGRYWIGVWKDSIPGPQDLARKSMRQGHDVELGDGALWHVPVARFFPQINKLASDGTVVREADARYAGLFAYVGKIVQHASTGSIPWDLLFNAAGDFLAQNYHISKWELSALGVLTDNAFDGFVDAIIDGPGLRDAQKKTASVAP